MSDVRVGILGLGRGFAHLRNFLATEGCHVVGACDWYESRHERAKEHLTVVEKQTKLFKEPEQLLELGLDAICLLYTSPSPRDGLLSRMPYSA